MTRSLQRPLAALLACVLAGTAPALAQGFDRTRPPVLPPPARLTMPAVETATLANGLRLYVVPMHEVPLVQFTLLVSAGARRDGHQPGLASFAAGMLDEGAGTRDANAVAAQVAYLGASLFTGAGWDAAYVSLKTPRTTMDSALNLMADVALRPRFLASEVQRQRDLRLASIIQQRDQPNTMASLAFYSLLFPAAHPYHQPLGGDSAATATLDSATVRQFYQRYYAPSAASLVVTGDITMEEARRAVDQRFGSWAGGQAPALPPVTATALDRPTTIYLVDKPGAPQSVIYLGSAGVDRNNPDYAAIEVMNTLLGGSFSSRLNTNLRETRGYTYGAGSGFIYRPVPGPFRASAAVRTNVTDSSLIEFFKEIRRIRTEPVDSVELDRARAYLALSLAGEFETTSQVANQVADLLQFNLPLTWYNDFVPRIMAVTAADVQRVARKYLNPDRMTVVVVGDVAAIRPGIEALHYGPVSVVDLTGAEVR